MLAVVCTTKMSSSYSSDDVLPSLQAKKPPKKQTKPTRKPSTKKPEPVRILKRGEEDDDYTDTGDSNDAKEKKKTKEPKSTTTAATKKKTDKKKRKKKPEAAELPKALSIAFHQPPPRATTPTAVKVYGLEPEPMAIRTTLPNSPRKNSPNGGGEYAGPTFSNSPAPSALPKPAFTTQKASPPPTYNTPSKRNGLADAAFWMEGGLMSGHNTTNVSPTESPNRSGGVTPTALSMMTSAPIPTHRRPTYTDELQVGNPGDYKKRQVDDGGSGSMLLGLLRGTHEEQDLDMWSQGLKSLLKMS
jgi:hypothetical protein